MMASVFPVKWLWCHMTFCTFTSEGVLGPHSRPVPYRKLNDLVPCVLVTLLLHLLEDSRLQPTVIQPVSLHCCLTLHVLAGHWKTLSTLLHLYVIRNTGVHGQAARHENKLVGANTQYKYRKWTMWHKNNISLFILEICNSFHQGSLGSF